MTTDAIAIARESLIRDLPVIHAAALAASSIRSDHIRGLRVLLTAAQGNVCAGCGRDLTGRVVELCHVNPSSNERTGYEISDGNVYAGCKPCNTYDRFKSGIEIVSTMVRPDVVQRALPARPACLKAGDNTHDMEEVKALRG